MVATKCDLHNKWLSEVCFTVALRLTVGALDYTIFFLDGFIVFVYAVCVTNYKHLCLLLLADSRSTKNGVRGVLSTLCSVLTVGWMFLITTLYTLCPLIDM